MTGTLTHWQYDTFKVQWSDPSYEPTYVTFNVDGAGKVDRIAMQAVSPLAYHSRNDRILDFRPATEGCVRR